MGASSSTEKYSTQQDQEVVEEESIAASTGSLHFLRSAFSTLSSSSSSSFLPSLQHTLSLPLSLSSSSPPNLPHLPTFLSNLGPSITSLFFSPSQTLTLTPTPTWLDFLKGYNRCCARTQQASSSLDSLFLLYADACARSGIPCGLEFDPESDKVAGFLTPPDLTMIFFMCWAMERSSRVPGGGGKKVEAPLPDLTHLVVSAFELGADAQPEAHKVSLWALKNVPGIVNCLSRYVQERIKAASYAPASASSAASSSGDVQNSLLLTPARAWTISLALRNTSLSEEFSRVSFPELFNDDARDNILYRSSVHGKGLNRFWSSIEGYHGPLLIIISAANSDDGDRRWMIGILTDQGFENKETFYGNSGYLYAISPIFNVIAPSGKERNYVYSHLHPTGRVYEPNPKPVGLGFGGTLGNERIFIDEDFARVTVRHHAVDKTYQHGSLIPNQGFLPTEASLLEAEVWGFGGKDAKGRQDAYKKRETLFSQQRRKVDLKNFGWEDSPEKVMMDMMSDPNRVQREDR